MQQRRFEDEGKSKLVQEAKAMMNEGDDDNENKPAAEENSGPKIKMGRIGKKKKKGQARGGEGAREGGAAADSGFSKPTA